tara:strand:- start:53 stop:430 length:378 start_codon:yes stop_codon:yes gene_type:complete
MKIDRTKLIILDGNQERVVFVNSHQAWAHTANDLRDYLRMYVSGYTLNEVADHFDLTYGTVYHALKNNVVGDFSYFRKLHKVNRKRLTSGEDLMTMAQYKYKDYVRKPQGKWDETGRWVWLERQF